MTRRLLFVGTADQWSPRTRELADQNDAAVLPVGYGIVPLGTGYLVDATALDLTGHATPDHEGTP